MRIGTWNVEYAYENRLEGLRRVLAENPADIWILTETHDDLIPLGCSNVAHSAPRPKNWSGIRAGSRWVSIWAKFPIVKTVATIDAERTICVLLQVSVRETMLVYGTVMPWHSDRGSRSAEETVPNWSEHHRVVPIQCAEWSDIMADHKADYFYAAGDFNTDMGTGRRYGTKQGIAALRDGLNRAGLFCATEPGRVPPELLSDPLIDHIALPLAWASKTRIEAAWPPRKSTLSDHSGVVVSVHP